PVCGIQAEAGRYAGAAEAALEAARGAPAPDFTDREGGAAERPDDPARAGDADAEAREHRTGGDRAGYAEVGDAVRAAVHPERSPGGLPRPARRCDRDAQGVAREPRPERRAARRRR